MTRCAPTRVGIAWLVLALSAPFVPATEAAADPVPSEFDAVLDALQPVVVRLQPGKTSLTRRLRIKLWNASPRDTSPQAFALVVAGTDCPEGTIVGQPDFEPRTPGDQNSVVIAPGRSRSARLNVTVTAADFSSVARRVPARCTIWFEAQSLAENNVDPTPRNNLAFLEINVLNLSGPVQAGAPEYHLDSFRASHPGKIELRAGQVSLTKFVRATLVNSGPDPATMGLAIDDGSCPAGTVGEPDFDRRTPGAQTTVLLPPGGVGRATIPVTVAGADFFSPTTRARDRCVAVLTATSSSADAEASNNTTRMVVNVLDRSDL